MLVLLVLGQLDFASRFWTGTSCAPALGVRSAKHSLTLKRLSHSRFPVSHTCFNDIELPHYRLSEKDEFERVMLMAIRESNGTSDGADRPR